MSRKIGITGGIGSGKSFICNRLKQLGYPVYNCDDEAKRLMVEDQTIVDGITSLIGENAYIDGQLNRPVVAEFLFKDTDNAAKINAIVHPEVRKDFELWAENQQSDTVFMECAILFESGFESSVDLTVLVYAPAAIRLKRAMVRDKATEAQIRSRMSHQISDEEALQRADYIFEHIDYDTTETEITKLINHLEQC